MEESPPLDILVEDALALGYEVIVLVIDDEEENQLWCANTGLYVPNIEANHGHDLNFIARLERELERLEDSEAWQSAMEKEHGGRIITEEEIDHEEYLNQDKNTRNRRLSMSKLVGLDVLGIM